MRSRWEIWSSDTRGNRLKLANSNLSLGLGRALNSVGEFWLDLPTEFDINLTPLDNLIEFWRAPEGGALSLQAVGFIKDRDRWSKGRRIAGPDQVDILKTRIIAYPAGDTMSDVTDNYDDMMKFIVSTNFGASSTDTTRSLASYNLTIAGDASLAPSGSMAFSHQNVLETLQKISGASREAGTELYFDLVPTVQSDQSLGFEFRTYIDQPGQDRTDGTQNPVYFGEKWGNLENGHLRENARDEINYVYVGGTGEKAARIIETVSNTTRIGRSPWNRREGFVNYSNSDSTAVLVAAGQTEITESRPRRTFSGKLMDTPKARYGRDWALGYRVTCDQDGEQFDALVRTVEFQVQAGQESITSLVEVEE